MGKAKNLKNRVLSYRRRSELVPRIRTMVDRARYLAWRELGSELEAILVEAELIHAYQPPFNVLLKDDKSPLYIALTAADFPQVLRVRQRDLQKKQFAGARAFGPFASANQTNELLKIVRPIFPWCNQADKHQSATNLAKEKSRPCFYYHLGLCPGACAGEISRADYHKTIDQLALFLQGKIGAVKQLLNRQMKAAAAAENFEAAARLRDQLALIATVTAASHQLKPDYSLPGLTMERATNSLVVLRQLLADSFKLPRQYQFERIEGYDVSNTSGQEAVVSMVVFTAGASDKSEYRSFNIRSLQTPNDPAMLAEALGRRITHDEWRRSSLLLIDGGKGQLRRVLEVLRGSSWQQVPIVGLAKNPDRIMIPQVTNWQPLKITWQILRLPDDNLGLQLLQQVRDEAHRFGKSHHTKRRDRATLNQ